MPAVNQTELYVDYFISFWQSPVNLVLLIPSYSRRNTDPGSEASLLASRAGVQPQALAPTPTSLVVRKYSLLCDHPCHMVDAP